MSKRIPPAVAIAIIILALIAAAGFLFVYHAREVASLNVPSPPIRPATDEEAYGVVTNFVKRELLSPYSAAFPPAKEAAISDTDNIFTIYGHVDSQNTFGAMLRTDFNCAVRYYPHTREWRCVALMINYKKFDVDNSIHWLSR